jgi:trehalose 6-phosphate synthase
VLVQVAVPSRGDVEEYQNLRAVVNELVGRINGKFGTIEFMPIHFMHKSVSFDELIALYAVSDVCLVTSTRDGMNLVSYEYIATQEKRKGVMILSEFTGAAQSLNGSLIVNPWNTEELADALHDAVTMGEEQRAINYQKLSKYVKKYTSAWWGQTFVRELVRISDQTEKKLSIRKNSHVGFADEPPTIIELDRPNEQTDGLEYVPRTVMNGDVFNSPKPGTPVQQGELIGANGQPIVTTPEKSENEGNGAPAPPQKSATT